MLRKLLTITVLSGTAIILCIGNVFAFNSFLLKVDFFAPLYTFVFGGLQVGFVYAIIVLIKRISPVKEIHK